MTYDDDFPRPLGDGMDQVALLERFQDVSRWWIDGERYPRVVINPHTQPGQVLVGDGATPPTPLSGGGGGGAATSAGPIASRPAAGTAGRLYFGTDTGLFYLDNGTSWDTLTQPIDGAITNAKLANMATQQLKGRDTAGTGPPEDITVLQALNWLLTTKGDIPVRGASNAVVVAVGSDGQVLTADAASPAGVKWSTPTGGSGSTDLDVAQMMAFGG